MSDGFAPIKGKCNYWREQASEEDRWDPRVKKGDRRVTCSCFVEGDLWEYTETTIPGDCPDRHHCRYYIRTA